MNFNANLLFELCARKIGLENSDIIRLKTMLDGITVNTGGIFTNDKGMVINMFFEDGWHFNGDSPFFSRANCELSKKDKQVSINIFKKTSVDKDNSFVHYLIKSLPNGYDVTIHLLNNEVNPLSNYPSGIYYISKHEIKSSLVEETIKYYDLEACEAIVPNYQEILADYLSNTDTINKLDNNDSLFNEMGIYPDILVTNETTESDYSTKMLKEINGFIKNSSIVSTYDYCRKILNKNLKKQGNSVLSLELK